jgi:hypothetical protein
MGDGKVERQGSDPGLEGGVGDESVRSARRLVHLPGIGRVKFEFVPPRRGCELLRRTRSLGTAARWRLFGLGGAFLATIPIWPALDGAFRTSTASLRPALDGAFRTSPNFEVGELVLLVAIVLLVPIAWVVIAADPGRIVSALLVASAAAWSLTTRLWASWATPPTVDDALRGYLTVGCTIMVTALWLDRHRNPIVRRPWLGLALLGVACAAIVVLPAVGDASIPGRDALLPLPKGVVTVAEDASCESRSSCERSFRLTADDGADPQEVARRLTHHLEARGWRIGVEHEAKACRPLGYLANPYRSCVSILPLRGPGTVEVLFDVFNPRGLRIIWASETPPLPPTTTTSASILLDTARRIGLVARQPWR